MTGWHSNQPFFSQGTTALEERWRKFVECGGDTMKINVIMPYMFLYKLLYMISPVFFEMTLVRPSICIIW
jgi:hypothetical protein